MLPYTPMLLDCILPTLSSHTHQSIRPLAIDANTNLFTLVFEYGRSELENVEAKESGFRVGTSVASLMELTSHSDQDTRIASLEWLLMLHRKFPQQVTNQSLFQGLLQLLSDFSEEVVRRDLQLLAQISNSSDDEYFLKFMNNLLGLFRSDRR